MGWGDSPTPRPPLPLGKTRYPLYRRLGGPHGRSERAENLVPTGIFFNTSIFIVLLLLHSGSHPFQPSKSQADRAAVCVPSVTLSQFYHPSSLPTLRLLKLFCHCRCTPRSLLLVVAVFLTLHAHLNSPQTLVM